jgi:hypothetical protein
MARRSASDDFVIFLPKTGNSIVALLPVKGGRNGMARSYESVSLSLPELPFALADVDHTAIYPTANPMHITQRRNLDMAVSQVMAIPIVSAAALKKVEDSCQPALSRMMATP